MTKIEELLFELYNNENLSVGVHGTGIIPDIERKRAKSICKNGLMNRYGDLRRTVAFQDRGMIHAHGNISLEDLLRYNYKKQNKGYIREEFQEGNHHFSQIKEVELEQCTFIVAIPTEMSTIDDDLYIDSNAEFDMEYAASESDLMLGKNKSIKGKVLNPKYIVGYFENGNIESIEWNREFYGFKQQETEFPELDLENIQLENENVRRRNQEKEEKKVEELGKETIEQQKQTKSKNFIVDLLNKLKEKMKVKNVKKDER